jgi:hypothetical protein
MLKSMQVGHGGEKLLAEGIKIKKVRTIYLPKLTKDTNHKLQCLPHVAARDNSTASGTISSFSLEVELPESQHNDSLRVG